MSAPPIDRYSTPDRSTDAESVGPSVSQRGSARPKLNTSYSSASRSSASVASVSAASARSARGFRERSFSIESKATTRPPLRPQSSKILSAVSERGRGKPLQLAGRAGDVDLLQLRLADDAEDGVDGLFVHFAVKELRSVEDRARHSAHAKREELRLMVGERYRDLLSAADSIVRMRKSASALLGRLEVAQQDCSHEELDERARIGRRATKPSAGSSRTPYTTATLIKLLLDSPEHVWRAIERNDFLSAARLEAVARAVYRALAGAVDREGDMEEEDELTSTFPLVEQQWETILQLGPQIVQRAKASLQHHEVSSREAVETLAAVIMVENTPIAEALSLFLDSRARALQAIFDPTASTSPLASPSWARRAPVSSDIETTLRHSIQLILQTVEHVKVAFGSGTGGSALVELLERLQISPDLASSRGPMQSPFVEKTINVSATGALPSILATLPNAHTLLRYLPPSILSFTPFVNTAVPADAPKTEKQLADWLFSTLQKLATDLSSTLTGVVSASRMVQLRDGLLDVWRSQKPSSEADTLLRVVNGALEGRFTQTYEDQLARLVRTLPDELQAALRSLPTVTEDLDFSAFVYSSNVPYPSLSNAPSSAGSPFQAFEEAIDRRLQGRTPLIDAILRGIEANAEALHGDMKSWLERSSDRSSLAKYRTAAQRSLQAIEASMREVLASHMTDPNACLFVSNLARCLATCSPFAKKLLLDDIDAEEAVTLLSEWQTALDHVNAAALSPWQEDACARAIEIIRTAFAALSEGHRHFDASSCEPDKSAANGHVDGQPLAFPTQPGGALNAALFALVSAVGPRLAGSEVSRQLLADFSSQAIAIVSDSLDAATARQPALAYQVLFDIAFLQRLGGASNDWAETEQVVLTKIGAAAPLAQEAVRSRAEAALRRQQNLLAPLLQTSAAFLALGQPAVSSEYRSPLGVATPGPRFGSLPVPALAR